MSSSCEEDNGVPKLQGASTTYQDEQASHVWEQRYEELVHFQRGYGHCRVPTDGSVLGKWVMHLREKYKRFVKEQRYRGQLTQERIDRLNALGFEWSLRPPTTPWDERFQQLQEFHQEHGHTRVKRSYCLPDEQQQCSFAEWVQKQRKLFRGGKLPQERVQKLQSLKFEQRLVPTGKTWEESFQLLVEFRRKHGHARVPKPPKHTSKDKQEEEDDYSLRVWADRQRTLYHSAFTQKKPCILTKKRVKQLNEIGFDWGLHTSTQRQGWKEKFQQLQDFQQHYGDCNVPTAYPENKSLGRWVSEQRAQYNKRKKGLKSSMTPERQVALEGIGFQWKKPLKSAKAGVAVAPASLASVESTAAAAASVVDDDLLLMGPSVDTGVTVATKDDAKLPATVSETDVGPNMSI